MVATVDGVPITIHDVVTEGVRQHAVSRATEDPNAFLQRLVDRQALVTMALAQGLHRDPELSRQYENLLIGALRERQLTPRLAELTVSDDEVRESYEADQQRYRVAGSIHVAVLRLQFRPGREPEATRRLTEVAAALQAMDAAEPGFGKLAIDNSDHQASRYQGGDIGWLRDGKGPAWLPANVIAAAWDLTTPGQLSPVLAGEQAAFLVRLLERREAASRPLAEVSAAIRSELLAAKRRQAEEDVAAQARQAVTVEVHQAALDAAVQQLGRQVLPQSDPEPPPPPPP